MTYDFIEKLNIQPVNEEAMKLARQRQDSRVKVPRSLGRLEEISIRLAGITGEISDNDMRNQAIVLMCADNGIVEEGVASAPQTVTLMQTINFTKYITGVGSQAKYFGIDLLPVDVGVKLAIPEEVLTKEMGFSDKVVDRRVSSGTKNFLKDPAMTLDECKQAILAGIEAAEACATQGKSLIGVGEMGIGNTTTAASLITALWSRKNKKSSLEELADLLEETVGRGGGLNDEGLRKKKEVILSGLEKYKGLFDCSEEFDPLALLAAVGGLDIAGMAGVYLGAAAKRIPVVVDGVISIAAALIAVEFESKVKDYLFTSHRSDEGSYGIASELLGIEPMYDLGMKLGEGSGCPIAFKIIEAASAVMTGMVSLDEASVDSAYLEQLKKEGQFQ